MFYRYVVKEILGQGTFGQVAKCWVAETSSFVAVKIIKNQPAYYQQALVEVSILTTVINSVSMKLLSQTNFDHIFFKLIFFAVK